MRLLRGVRILGRDEDDDKHSTHHRHGRKSRRTQDTGPARQAGATPGARRDPRARGRWTGERRARRQEEGRGDIGSQQGQHRQSPRTKAVVTRRDGEPHTVNYTRVGFETLHFLEPGIGGTSRGYGLSLPHIGFVVVDVAAPSTSEPRSAQRAPNGSAPVRKFTAP